MENVGRPNVQFQHCVICLSNGDGQIQRLSIRFEMGQLIDIQRVRAFFEGQGGVVLRNEAGRVDNDDEEDVEDDEEATDTDTSDEENKKDD